MARYTESRELVQQIARATLEQGRSVSNSEVAAAIFERTGVRASPNLVAEELQRFWALIGRELAQRNQIPSVPAAVVSALEGMWRQAVEEANARWGAERSELMTQAERLGARVAQLEQTLDAQVQQYQQAETQLLAQRTRAAQAEKVAEQQETALAVAAQTAQALTAEALALKDQLAAVQQALLYGEREATVLRELAQDSQAQLAAARAQLQEAREDAYQLRERLMAAELEKSQHASQAAAARTLAERLEHQLKNQDRRDLRRPVRGPLIRKPGGVR